MAEQRSPKPLMGVRIPLPLLMIKELRKAQKPLILEGNLSFFVLFGYGIINLRKNDNVEGRYEIDTGYLYKMWSNFIG